MSDIRCFRITRKGKFKYFIKMRRFSNDDVSKVLEIGRKVVEEGEGWGFKKVLGMEYEEEGDEVEREGVVGEAEEWLKEGEFLLFFKEGMEGVLTILLFLRVFFLLQGFMLLRKYSRMLEGKGGGGGCRHSSTLGRRKYSRGGRLGRGRRRGSKGNRGDGGNNIGRKRGGFG